MDVIRPPARMSQALMLNHSDPLVAANKRIVHAMWREVLQGGQVSRIPHYFREDYIQHNPNIPHGRDALATYISGSRPAGSVEDRILFPLIAIIGEGDLVLVVNERPYPQPDGTGSYVSSWFDLFRVQDGKIAEHWDAATKDPSSLHFDPNANR